jgi:hypothetical protein
MKMLVLTKAVYGENEQVVAGPKCLVRPDAIVHVDTSRGGTSFITLDNRMVSYREKPLAVMETVETINKLLSAALRCPNNKTNSKSKAT